MNLSRLNWNMVKSKIIFYNVTVNSLPWVCDALFSKTLRRLRSCRPSLPVNRHRGRSVGKTNKHRNGVDQKQNTSCAKIQCTGRDRTCTAALNNTFQSSFEIIFVTKSALNSVSVIFTSLACQQRPVNTRYNNNVHI